MFLRTLGELSLEQAGQKVVLPRRVKNPRTKQSEWRHKNVGTMPLLILTRLILEGPQIREDLANMLWSGFRGELVKDKAGNIVEEKPLANLRVALQELRQALGEHRDLLCNSDPNYKRGELSLAKGFRQHVECDVLCFNEHLANQELDKAKALYKGEFLADFEERFSRHNLQRHYQSSNENELYRWLSYWRQRIKDQATELLHEERAFYKMFGTGSIASLLPQTPNHHLAHIDANYISKLYRVRLESDYPQSQKDHDLKEILRRFETQVRTLDPQRPYSFELLLGLVLQADIDLPKLHQALTNYLPEPLSFSQCLSGLDELAMDGWITQDKQGHIDVVHKQLAFAWLNEHLDEKLDLTAQLLNVTPQDQADRLWQLCEYIPTNMLGALGGELLTKLELAFVTRAKTLLHQGEPAEATHLLDSIKHLIDMYSLKANPELVFLHTLALERLGDYAKANRLLEGYVGHADINKHLIQGLPHTDKLLMLRAKLLFRTQDAKIAHALIQDVETNLRMGSWAHAMMHNVLGNIYLLQADEEGSDEGYEQAIEHFSEAATVWEDLQNEANFVVGECVNIAVCYDLQGKLEEAEAAYQQALQQADRLGASQLEKFRVLFNLGAMYHEYKDPQKAIVCYNDCLDFAKEHGLEGLQARVYLNKGIIAEKHFQDSQEAISCYRRAKELATQVSDIYEQGRAMAHLGLIEKNKSRAKHGINLMRVSGGDLADLEAKYNHLWP